MNRIAFLIALSVVFVYQSSAATSCKCACVNGKVTALCTSALDIQPMCGPEI